MTNLYKSTSNLLKHLKMHLDKIDPLVKKQAEFMKKFVNNLNSDSAKYLSYEGLHDSAYFPHFSPLGFWWTGSRGCYLKF